MNQIIFLLKKDPTEEGRFIKQCFQQFILRFVCLQTKKAQPIKYKLDVFSVSCKFWDEVDDNWSDKGCEVALESTMTEAVCKYATSFISQNSFFS